MQGCEIKIRAIKNGLLVEFARGDVFVERETVYCADSDELLSYFEQKFLPEGGVPLDDLRKEMGV